MSTAVIQPVAAQPAAPTPAIAQPVKTTSKYMQDEHGLWICPHCPERKNCRSTLFYHIRRHTGELPHICDVCDKGFNQKQTLDLHMQARHPAEFKAQQTAQKNRVEYKCPFDGCDYTSISKGNRRVHVMRTHLAETTNLYCTKEDTGCYSCDICTEEFNSSTNFYYHIAECGLTDDLFPDHEAVVKMLL
jgi:uncharacterized Zn-finger protein